MTQTSEWLYPDFIDDAKTRAKLVHKRLRGPRILLATAGPVRFHIVHVIPRHKGILDALFWEIVGAGCADAGSNAALPSAIGQKSMYETHVHPLLSLVVLPSSSSSSRSSIFFVYAIVAATGRCG